MDADIRICGGGGGEKGLPRVQGVSSGSASCLWDVAMEEALPHARAMRVCWAGQWLHDG